mgnify:FL=1
METEFAILRGDDGAFVGVESNGTTYTLETWNAHFEDMPALFDQRSDVPPRRPLKVVPRAE